MLNAEQESHFDAFGFLTLRGLFSLNEMDAIRGEFDDVMREGRGGGPRQGEAQSVQPIVERRPLLSALAEDDRIYGTVEQLLGPGFIWVGSDGNHYVGDTPWHADGLRGAIDAEVSGWEYPLIKVNLYLDPVTAEEGCLRFIPGSHARAFSDRLGPVKDRQDDPDVRPFGIEPRDMPGYPVETEPGDVIFFSQEVVHGSFGGVDRRQLAMSFATKPTTDAHLAFLRRSYESTKRTLRPHEAFVRSDRPRIRALVAPLVELGFDTIST